MVFALKKFIVHLNQIALIYPSVSVLRVYCMLDTIKAATEKILLIRNTARGRRCRDHPHFVDENTEVQSSTGNGPESHIR